MEALGSKSECSCHISTRSLLFSTQRTYVLGGGGSVDSFSPQPGRAGASGLSNYQQLKYVPLLFVSQNHGGCHASVLGPCCGLAGTFTPHICARLTPCWSCRLSSCQPVWKSFLTPSSAVSVQCTPQSSSSSAHPIQFCIFLLWQLLYSGTVLGKLGRLTLLLDACFQVWPIMFLSVSPRLGVILGS